MPGKKMNSIKNKAQYEDLRKDRGFSKASAAAISNASFAKSKRKGKSSGRKKVVRTKARRKK